MPRGLHASNADKKALVVSIILVLILSWQLLPFTQGSVNGVGLKSGFGKFLYYQDQLQTWKMTPLNNYTIDSFGFTDSKTLRFNLTSFYTSLPSNSFALQAWNTTSKAHPKFVVIAPSRPTFVQNAANHTWINNLLTVFGQSSNKSITVSYTAFGNGIFLFNSTTSVTSISYTSSSGLLSITTGGSGKLYIYTSYGAPTSVTVNGSPGVQGTNWFFTPLFTTKLVASGSTTFQVTYSVSPSNPPGGGGGSGGGGGANPGPPIGPPIYPQTTSTTAAQSSAYMINVYVFDPLTNTVIANATVTIGTVRKHTLQNGTALMGLFSAGSQYLISITKTGYDPAYYPTPLLSTPYTLKAPLHKSVPGNPLSTFQSLLNLIIQPLLTLFPGLLNLNLTSKPVISLILFSFTVGLIVSAVKLQKRKTKTAVALILIATAVAAYAIIPLYGQPIGSTAGTVSQIINRLVSYLTTRSSTEYLVVAAGTGLIALMIGLSRLRRTSTSKIHRQRKR